MTLLFWLGILIAGFCGAAANYANQYGVLIFFTAYFLGSGLSAIAMKFEAKQKMADAAEKYYYMGWEHSLSTKAEDGDHYACGKRLAKEFAKRVKAGE